MIMPELRSPRCVMRRRRGRAPSEPRCSRASTGSERFREAEVEHLDRAVAPHLHVRRLQVAMDDALLVRGLERVGDLPRDRQRLGDRNRPAADDRWRGRRPRPAPSPAPGRRRQPGHPRGRRSARCSGWFSAASVCASRLKRASRSGSCREQRRQHLDGDVAIEPCVAGAKHLAHSAFADGGEDFVRAQASPGRNSLCQRGGLYLCEVREWPFTVVSPAIPRCR